MGSLYNVYDVGVRGRVLIMLGLGFCYVRVRVFVRFMISPFVWFVC